MLSGTITFVLEQKVQGAVGRMEHLVSLVPVDQLNWRSTTDKQLLEHGRACRYMCTPEANLGKPPQESSVVHLREARAEWKRRHAKPLEKM
jgi:hypothetical protein